MFASFYFPANKLKLNLDQIAPASTSKSHTESSSTLPADTEVDQASGCEMVTDSDDDSEVHKKAMSNLQRAIDDARGKKHFSKRDKDKIEEAAAEVRRGADDVLDGLKARNETIATLQTQIRRKDVMVMEMEEEIRALDQKIAELQKAQSSAGESAFGESKLSEKLKLKNFQIEHTQLKSELSVLKDKLDTSTSELTASKQIIAALQSQITEANSTIEKNTMALLEKTQAQQARAAAETETTNTKAALEAKDCHRSSGE